MQNATRSLKNRILSTLLLVTATGVLFLYYWSVEAAETAHVKPAEEQRDISSIVCKIEKDSYLLPSKTELQILSGQTGLNEAAVKEMLHSGCALELLAIQNLYFAPVTLSLIHI